MRFLLGTISSLTILFSLSTHAKIEWKTVKVLDGKKRTCLSQRDVVLSENSAGIYRGQVQKVENLNNGLLRFHISLKFLECQKVNQSFSFLEKPVYLPVEFERRNKRIHISPVDVFFNGYKDGVYESLFSYKVSRQASASFVTQIDIALSDILDERQKLQLEMGRVANAQFDFWISKKMNWKVFNKETREPQSQFQKNISLGAMRVLLKIKN